MPDSKFDLGDYVEVKDRIAKFYDLFGQGRLVTQGYELTREPDDKPKVIVTALAYRTPDDPHPGVGTSWLYLPGATSYTKGSEIENAETSAWGRAIGSLGILILKSIATTNEINAKSGTDEPAPAGEGPVAMAGGDGSLIGTAQIGKAPSDFELRQTPEGNALSFRLASNGKSIKVVAHDPLASALDFIKPAVVGQAVTCWGPVHRESFVKDGRTIEYDVLVLEKIQTPDVLLPAPDLTPADEAELDAILA